jgi:hypothetical protein
VSEVPMRIAVITVSFGFRVNAYTRRVTLGECHVSHLHDVERRRNVTDGRARVAGREV